MNHRKAILGDAAAVALQKLRSFVTSNAASHVRPHGTTLRVYRDAGTDVIQATFKLEAPDEERRALILKTSTGAWRLQSLSCDRAEKEIVLKKGDANGALVALDLQRGAKSWHGAEINVVLHATSQQRGPSLIDQIFVAPEFLPEILGSDALSTQVEQTAMSWMRLHSAVGDGIEIGGVPCDPDNSLGIGLEMLQLIILPTVSLLDGSDSRLLLAGDSREASSQKRKAIVYTVETMFAFLSNWFGHPSGARVAVVLTENTDLAPSLGPCVVAPPAWLDNGASLADREMYMCRQLASTWWGVGCRIASPMGTQIAHAISAAVALRWLSETGKVAQRNRVLEAFRGHALKLKRQKSVRPIDWERTPAPGMALALGLDEALEKGTGVQAPLQGLTKQYWGKLIHPNSILRCFAETGVAQGLGVNSSSL